jgi:hypothetical protein
VITAFLRSRATILGFVAMILCAGTALRSQGVGGSEVDSYLQRFTSAANAWQTTPVDIQSQTDTVGSDVRASRNSFWKGIVDFEYKLMGDLAFKEPAATFPGSYLADAPEIPAKPNSIWVIAKFETFHVYEAPVDSVHQIIYTEMNFKVIEVVRQPQSLALMTGSRFDIGVLGGRIRMPDGTIVTSYVNPQTHFVQPDHTYLLDLNYESANQYYFVDKRWDLTSGKVAPDTEDEIARAFRRSSVLDGLSMSEAIQYLDSVLPRS